MRPIREFPVLLRLRSPSDQAKLRQHQNLIQSLRFQKRKLLKLFSIILVISFVLPFTVSSIFLQSIEDLPPSLILPKPFIKVKSY